MRGTFVIAMAVSIAWTACTVIRMAAPMDLAGGGDELQNDRPTFGLSYRTIAVGPYALTDLANGGSHTSRSGSNRDDRRSFTFRLRDGDESLEARCSQSTLQSHARLGAVTMSDASWSFSCECGAAKLEVEGGDGESIGRASIGDRLLQVRSAHEYDNGAKSHNPLGYRIEDGTVALGAVETGRPERMWLGRDLDSETRRHLACLLAGFYFLDTRTER